MNLLIGWNTQDITPARPVELVGQYYQRISARVRDPLMVTALALEQRGAHSTEQAVMVTMDIVNVDKDFLQAVRGALRLEVPDLNPSMVFINATHIHSGPSWFVPFRWWAPAAHVQQPAEIRSWLERQVVRAVVNAWQARQPGRIGAASALAATGFCRRMLYADGHAVMYGEANQKDFVGVEAGNDPEVRMLFTWNERDQLSGAVVNVACPAQTLEANYVVSGDFFGELRKRIQAAYGPQVNLLPQVSAAGDQSPRHLPTQASEDINYWSETGVVAIADRLERAVAQGHASARERLEADPPLRHTVTDLALPIRRARAEEHRAACAEIARLVSPYPDASTAARELFARFVADTHLREQRQPHGPFDNKQLDFVQLENAQAVIRRYESQDASPTFSVELHAVRLGECAFVTNPFELYLDYGQMIQARSRARKTFIVQLACDRGRYLPTARAEAAGGYGALIINGAVGSEGGRLLVEATVRAIDNLWSDAQVRPPKDECANTGAVASPAASKLATATTEPS